MQCATPNQPGANNSWRAVCTEGTAVGSSNAAYASRCTGKATCPTSNPRAGASATRARAAASATGSAASAAVWCTSNATGNRPEWHTGTAERSRTTAVRIPTVQHWNENCNKPYVPTQITNSRARGNAASTRAIWCTGSATRTRAAASATC